MDEKIAFRDILDELKKGRYVIWEHDGVIKELTSEYLERYFVAFVDTPEDGYALCRRLQRKQFLEGEEPKTYIFSNKERDEHACVPNLTQEESEQVRRVINAKRMMGEPPKP